MPRMSANRAPGAGRRRQGGAGLEGAGRCPVQSCLRPRCATWRLSWPLLRLGWRPERDAGPDRWVGAPTLQGGSHASRAGRMEEIPGQHRPGLLDGFPPRPASGSRPSV